MRRHCNGADTTLVKEIGRDEKSRPIYVPCNCGRVFDDVYNMTIYPHERV